MQSARLSLSVVPQYEMLHALEVAFEEIIFAAGTGDRQLTRAPFPASLGHRLPDRCEKALSPSIPSQGQLKALLHDLLSHIDPGPAQESRSRHYQLKNANAYRDGVTGRTIRSDAFHQRGFGSVKASL
jgi:hypothetical protein